MRGIDTVNIECVWGIVLLVVFLGGCSAIDIYGGLVAQSHLTGVSF